MIRGGLLEGNVVGDAEIKRLATLPPADVLRAQLVGAVAAPLTTVVGLFTAPLRDLVGVLDARIRQLEEQGETVPEPEAGGRAAKRRHPRSRRQRQQAKQPAEEAQKSSPKSRRQKPRGFGRPRGGAAGWLRPIPTSSSRPWAG